MREPLLAARPGIVAYDDGMRSHGWMLVALGGAIWFVVQRRADDSPEPPAPIAAREVRVESRAVAERVHAAAVPPTLAIELEPIEVDEDEPERELIWESLPGGVRNSMHGRVRDANNHELLAGVTIIARRLDVERLAIAITDEDGYWLLPDLPAGVYTVNLYYIDHAVERSGVVVSGDDPTVLMFDLDTTQEEPYTIVVD